MSRDKDSTHELNSILAQSKHIDITCIINCHRESYLINSTLKCVDRALTHAQSCGLTLEVIIARDNSDDDTIDIVERYASGKSYWQILELCNGDLASSRNDALNLAKGKYTAFIDGDDLWCETWLLDCFMYAENREDRIILHPEYNVYFGGFQHIFKHVDMESERFERDYLYYSNYWTSLSFSNTSLYKEFPYRRNTITDGFGYEDWTWNYETMTEGYLHKIVPGTAHYIRRGKAETSLLDKTQEFKAIPRIFELYENLGKQSYPVEKAA